MFQVIYIYF